MTEKAPKKDHLQWGPLWLHVSLARFFSAIGRPGSGKTVLFRNLLQSLLALRPMPRIAIFDPKYEFEAFCVEAAIPHTILNSYSDSAHSSAWRMSTDIRTEEQVQALADVMYPIENQQNPFFDEAAQEQGRGNLAGHIASGKPWTLLDHLLSLRDPDLMRSVLAEAPEENRHRLKLYWDDKKGPNRDVMSSVGNKIGRYISVARRWAELDRDTALQDWMEKGDLLLIQRSYKNLPATNNINRVFIHLMIQALLDEGEARELKSFLILDEFPKILKGNEEIIGEMLSLGRSRGLGAALGFQSRAGVSAQSSRDASEDMLSMIHNWAFLAVNDHETAEWCSQQLGEVDLTAELRSESESSGPQGSSYQQGTSETIEKAVRRVHPSELRNYKQFLHGYVDYIEGWVRLSSLGTNVKMKLPAHEVMRSLVRPDHMPPLSSEDVSGNSELPYPKRNRT